MEQLPFTKTFHSIHQLLLDTLFPIFCLGCNKPDVWLCENCLMKIELITFQVCPYCEKEFSPSGMICQRCKLKQLEQQSRITLDSLTVATSYQHSLVSKLIHLYKYRFIEDLANPLGTILTKSLLRQELPLPDVIIPIPLHRQRLRWRGFNQSQKIADHLSNNLTPGYAIPVVSEALQRKLRTKPQMGIKSYQARMSNLKDAFTLSEPSISNLVGKKLLLIDDVATTGATLMEAAKVLKENGVSRVSAAVIARQTVRA